MMKGKITINLLALLLICGTSLPAVAANWGEFRSRGVRKISGRWVEIHEAILWNIPSGHDWEEACSKQPANINGIHFDRPTACSKSKILGPLSLIISGIGVATLIFPPTAGLGAVLTYGGAGVAILDSFDVGALNIWGIFYVQTNEPPARDNPGTTNPRHRLD